MVKKLSKMALVCLAVLCISSTETTETKKTTTETATETASITMRPTVRIMFEGIELIANAGYPFTIYFYYTNTNRFLIFRDDDSNMRIEYPQNGTANTPEENLGEFSDVITDYDYLVEYTIIAESEGWDRDYAYISYRTRPYVD